MDIFRKDVRVADFLGVVVLIGDVWLKLPYSGTICAIGISGTNNSGSAGIILDMSGRIQLLNV